MITSIASAITARRGYVSMAVVMTMILCIINLMQGNMYDVVQAKLSPEVNQAYKAYYFCKPINVGRPQQTISIVLYPK